MTTPLQTVAREVAWFIREARELADTPADQRDEAWEQRQAAFLARKAEVLAEEQHLAEDQL